MATRAAVTFIDTNIIIDIFERDAVWFDWSAERLGDAVVDGMATINPIVIAELSRNFDSADALRAKLSTLQIISTPIHDDAAFLAGKRFQRFRQQRTGGEAARVLPDFLIGAHAVTLGIPLLTRDARLYRRYFPDLTIITPETDHD